MINHRARLPPGEYLPAFCLNGRDGSSQPLVQIPLPTRHVLLPVTVTTSGVLIDFLVVGACYGDDVPLGNNHATIAIGVDYISTTSLHTLPLRLAGVVYRQRASPHTRAFTACPAAFSRVSPIARPCTRHLFPDAHTVIHWHARTALYTHCHVPVCCDTALQPSAFCWPALPVVAFPVRVRVTATPDAYPQRGLDVPHVTRLPVRNRSRLCLPHQHTHATGSTYRPPPPPLPHHPPLHHAAVPRLPVFTGPPRRRLCLVLLGPDVLQFTYLVLAGEPRCSPPCYGAPLPSYALLVAPRFGWLYSVPCDFCSFAERSLVDSCLTFWWMGLPRPPCTPPCLTSNWARLFFVGIRSFMTDAYRDNDACCHYIFHHRLCTPHLYSLLRRRLSFPRYLPTAPPAAPATPLFCRGGGCMPFAKPALPHLTCGGDAAYHTCEQLGSPYSCLTNVSFAGVYRRFHGY